MIQEAKPEKLNQGKIVLDNQALELTIHTPSGRIEVKDKITELWWLMPNANECGHLVLERDGLEKSYYLGDSSRAGVAFKANYYMKRNTENDDFHDISLSGSLGDQPNTQVTLRYLLSNAFPTLHCFAYLEGPETECAKAIRFPIGFAVTDSPMNKIFLPKDLKSYQHEKPESAYDALWQPAKDEAHKVAGAPVFVQTQEGDGKGSACLGFLSHPLCTLEIQRHQSSRWVTAVSVQLEQTGRTLEAPHHVQFHFLPTINQEALAWTCFDVLNQAPQPFYL